MHFDALKRRGVLPNFLFVGDSVLHLASFQALYNALNEKGIFLAGVACNAIAPGRKLQFTADNLIKFIPAKQIEYLENASTIDLRESPIETFSASLRMLKGLRKLPQPTNPTVTCLEELATRMTEGAFLYVHSEAKSFPKYSLELPILSQGASVVEVLIEEGTGTYTQTDKSWFRISILKTKSRMMRIAKLGRWALFAPINHIVDREFRKKIPQYSFCMFNRESEPVEVNSEYKTKLKETLEQSSIKVDYKNTVICATTVLFEECGSNADLKIISRMVDCVGRFGYDVVIKPHPRERNLSRYEITGATVEKLSEVSLEELVAGSPNKPSCVVGFGSSSQIMLNVLYGIPAIDISRLLTEENILRATNGVRLRNAFNSEQLDLFHRLFSPYILEVGDEDELLNQLKTICSSMHDG